MMLPFSLGTHLLLNCPIIFSKPKNEVTWFYHCSYWETFLILYNQKETIFSKNTQIEWTSFNSDGPWAIEDHHMFLFLCYVQLLVDLRWLFLFTDLALKPSCLYLSLIITFLELLPSSYIHCNLTRKINVVFLSLLCLMCPNTPSPRLSIHPLSCRWGFQGSSLQSEKCYSCLHVCPCRPG